MGKVTTSVSRDAENVKPKKSVVLAESVSYEKLLNIEFPKPDYPQTPSHTLPLNRMSTMKEVCSEVVMVSKPFHGLLIRSLVVSYLTLVLMQSIITNKFTKLFREPQTWCWVLEILYFSYSLYLALLRHAGYGQEGLSFWSLSVNNIFAEIQFSLQTFYTFKFWMYEYPVQMDERFSMLEDIQYYGVGNLIMCVDYFSRTGSFLNAKRSIVVLSFLYCVVFLPISLLVPLIDGTEGPQNITKIVPFVVFLAFVDTTTISHKLNYFIDNIGYFYEAAKTTLGISYMMINKETGDDSPTHTVFSLKRAATNITTEILNPLGRHTVAELSGNDDPEEEYVRIGKKKHRKIGQIILEGESKDATPSNRSTPVPGVSIRGPS